MLLTFEKNITANQSITISGDIKYILNIKLKQALANFYSNKGGGRPIVMMKYKRYLLQKIC
ncbi:MAG: hypothetical protein ACJAS9_003002 [Polaribacter sp.]|jgi:hypothetical protein